MAKKIKDIEINLAKTGIASLEVDKATATTVFQQFVRGYLARVDLTSSLPLPTKDFSIGLEQVRNYLASYNPTEAMSLLSTLNPLMGQIQTAEESLLKAYSLSTVYPYANSGFVAKAYLVHLYSETQKKEDAEKFLNIMDLDLDAATNSDTWISRKLIFLRAKSHFLRAFGDEIQLKNTLLISYHLAKVLRDNYLLQKCTEELKVLESVCAQVASYDFKGWVYFPDLKLIIKLSPREIIRLEKSQIMVDILNQLVSGSKSQSELFENVWKLSFHERHAPHLRANLSKLRKHLPKNALTVSDSIVALT